MKWALVRIKTPYQGNDNVLQDCFIIIERFKFRAEAELVMANKSRPDWYVIIKVW